MVGVFAPAQKGHSVIHFHCAPPKLHTRGRLGHLMHMRLTPGSGNPQLFIHATGAWNYAGGEDDDESWPVVAAFEV